MNWAIMAHIVASITVFTPALPLYLPRESTPLQTQKVTSIALFLCRENSVHRSYIFLTSSCLTPNKGDLLIN